MPLTLAGSTFGSLYDRSLESALSELAELGLSDVELVTLPPHLPLAGSGPYERRWLRRLLTRLDLRVTSINPTYVDLNPVSTNQGIQQLTHRQLLELLELASDLEAGMLIVLGGRRHGLLPVAMEDAFAILLEQLGQLADRADELGVDIGVENSPYGFIDTAAELARVVDTARHDRIQAVYDTANALANEDPAEGVRTLGSRLGLAHISDTWRQRWAHTQVGRGEVDFAGFAAALREAGFDGVTVYELADGEPVAPRVRKDLLALQRWGWAPR